MKLPNGFGSVYKLSGNRRKPWIARITIGSNSVGKQIFQTIGYFEEKKLALDALAKHRIGPVVPKSNITFEELYKEWSVGKYEYISRQTVDCYKAGWNHLSKYKNVKFKELRTAHIQSVIDGCFKAKKSRSTLSKIKIVASLLYDYAVQNDIVNKNYAVFVKLPKVDREEKEIFTDLEIQKLEKSELPWVDTILILIYTGFRINEFLGLTKFSVNFNNQTITGGFKTDAGKDRIVPIHPKILKHVKAWYDKNGDYLICRDTGKRISDKMYREKFYYPTLKSLGIREELNPHCCRHTCASLLAKAGADTLSIQRILGHAKYSFTADNYTRTDLEELRKAILKL